MGQTNNRKFYYGWIITLLAGLTYFGSNGLLSASSGNIISQLLLVKGWDPTQVSLTYTIKSFIGLAIPLVGLALRKYGPRRCIFWTTLVTAICLAATGWVNSPGAFIIVYGLAVSISMMFNDQLACFAAVNNWWDRRRGEHGGYVQAMGALGGIIFPPIIAWMFMSFTWKSTLIIMAVALMIITAIPQMIFMKDYPAQMGLEIDGGAPTKPEKAKKAVKKAWHQSNVNWDVKDAIRTPQVWLMGITWGGVTFGYCAVMYFGITHMMMNGWGDIRAAGAVSLLSLFILIGSLALSPLTDRLNPRLSLFLISALCGVGYLLFDFAAKSGNMAFMVVAMIFAGAPDGPIICAVMNGLCSCYGPKNYPAIQPYCNIILTLIAASASIVCGYFLSTTGTLSAAYYFSAIFAFVVAFAALFIKPPKMSEKLAAKYAARAASEAASE